jgi:hypothetical protein
MQPGCYSRLWLLRSLRARRGPTTLIAALMGALSAAAPQHVPGLRLSCAHCACAHFVPQAQRTPIPPYTLCPRHIRPPSLLTRAVIHPCTPNCCPVLKQQQQQQKQQAQPPVFVHFPHRLRCLPAFHWPSQPPRAVPPGALHCFVSLQCVAGAPDVWDPIPLPAHGVMDGHPSSNHLRRTGPSWCKNACASLSPCVRVACIHVFVLRPKPSPESIVWRPGVCLPSCPCPWPRSSYAPMPRPGTCAGPYGPCYAWR